MQSPSTPVLDDNDPGIRVSMSDDLVVIRPPSRVDLDTTHVLVDAAASAITAGSVVMVELDRGSGEDVLWFRPRRDDIADPLIDTIDGAEVLGAGRVRLSTRSSYWTIDFERGRLYRADTLVDPYFVADSAWTSVRALWITRTHVTALTDDGTYVSTRTSWAKAQRPRWSIPA